MIEIGDLYRGLVESSDDAIIAKTPDGIVFAWNPAAERLFGYKAEEMIGQSVRRLLPPDLIDEEDRILARIGAGERVGQFFTRRVHRSGALLDVSITVSPIRDGEGRVVGASKIARDARPYLESQRRLAESERGFRMLADNIAQLMWIADTQGLMRWYNRRWYEYTGAAPGETEGQDWQKIIHRDHRDRVVMQFREAIASGAEWEDTFPLRRHDGEWRWFLSRAKPIIDESGTIERWFGTNTDITAEREQAEQIRLLLNEINHRSKNLLGVVQALARRTARGAEPDFLRRFEARIKALAANQDMLVRRAWSSVPVREPAEAQMKFVEAAPGEFTIEGPDVLLLPRAAETLGMALHELATNALKYGALSVDGGHVDIGWSVEHPEGGEPRFCMWWRESGGPPVVESGHNGFGTTLIKDVPRHNLGAEVTFAFHETGVCWEICCPLSAAVAKASGPA